jgi:N-acetylmuramoyl-L-alanine amidase
VAKQHTATGGDSVESVAYANGHFWETVWNDPANGPLRQRRDDPNILEEGDVLTVPDLRIKEVSKPTDQKYRFRRKGVPSKIEVRLTIHDGEPRPGVPYTVTMGKRKLSGSSDGEGWIRFGVMPDIKRGTITLATGETYEFEVGSVRPAAILKGVQGRLRNLAYFHGAIDGEMSDDLAEAIERYQRDRKLQVTGKADDVASVLEEEHGS